MLLDELLQRIKNTQDSITVYAVLLDFLVEHMPSDIADPERTIRDEDGVVIGQPAIQEAAAEIERLRSRYEQDLKALKASTVAAPRNPVSRERKPRS